MAENINEKIEDKNEEEFINDLKEKIKVIIEQTAIKVNGSALNYMVKQKKWIPETSLSEAEKFFSEKIPTVLSEEASKKIYSDLGLN
jgi:hypothetical protein